MSLSFHSYLLPPHFLALSHWRIHFYQTRKMTCFAVLFDSFNIHQKVFCQYTDYLMNSTPWTEISAMFNICTMDFIHELSRVPTGVQYLINLNSVSPSMEICCFASYYPKFVICNLCWLSLIRTLHCVRKSQTLQ